MSGYFSGGQFISVDVTLHDALAPGIEISGTGADLDISVHLSGENTNLNYSLTNGTLSLLGTELEKGGYTKFDLGSSQIWLYRADLLRIRDGIGPQNRSEMLFHNQEGWSGNRATVMMLQVGGEDILLASRHGMSGFASFSMDADGLLSPLASVSDNAQSYAADVYLMASAEIGGRTFVFTASQSESGISSYELKSDDSITLTHSIGAAEGVGMNAPNVMLVANVNGQDFLLVGDAGTHMIKVLQISANGVLSEVHSVMDSTDTRFADISVLQTIEVSGRTLVLAGGSDDGLSLFILTPTGQLVLLDTIEDTNALGLTNVTNIELRLDQDVIHGFVTSESVPGLTHITIDISSLGNVLVGDGGADTLTGGGKNDILLDGAGQDVLTGGAGADLFVLAADGARDDIMDFTIGQDRVDLSRWENLYSVAQLEIVSITDGARVSYGTEVFYLHTANGQPLTYQDFIDNDLLGLYRPPLTFNQPKVRMGTSENDRLTGTSADEKLQGMEGDDWLEGLDGADEIDGNQGNDTLVGGNDNDRLIGGVGNDRVWAGNGRDVAWLGSGHDIFNDNGQSGENGRDTVHGGSGKDLINGGAGDDHFYGDSGDDTIFGGDGDDVLSGGSEWDQLSGGEGNDRVWGGNGCDRVWLEGGHDVFFDNEQTGAMAKDTVSGGWGNDTINGGGGNDYVYGDDGEDRLFGGAGDDVLAGGNGWDQLTGGAGNDRVWAGNGRDVAWLGSGDDIFQDNGQGGDNGRDTVYGGSGKDLIKGGAGDDQFYGDSGDDTISGGDGNDVLSGGSEWDQLSGGAGNDRVWGGNGCDRVWLGDGNDTFYDNTQTGENGADSIWGGSGSDTIHLGGGNDLVSGGADADVFVWNTTQSTGADRITDFQDGLDLLQMSGVSFADLTINSTADGALVSWSTGSVLLLDVEIANITADDFVFI
ncbi:hypothetical protein K3X13_15765 (plasmid) [Aliiroseovarius crassostreae]|uniref:calcium-binding protein n=1 Tax=Aliiroseovarius crassostreae TaxID=154981 RepID=UPI0021FBEDB4|nr:calcium-binding protein [Aliiroseovarius crassostreae]UWP93936.1 hypothetical protein K3X13_15765 [Aliiroseovarius crassostreae]